MDSNTNNLIITILIGLLLALLIHFLACSEPKITSFNTENSNSNANNTEIQSTNEKNNTDNVIENFQNNNNKCHNFKEETGGTNNALDENYLDNSNFSDDEKMYHLIKKYNTDIILEQVKGDYIKLNQLDTLEIRLQKMKKVLEGFNNQDTLYNTNGVITKTT